MARAENLHPKVNKLALDLFDKWKRRTHDKAFEDFDKLTITAIDEVIEELDPQQYDKALDALMPQILDQVYIYPKNLMRQLRDKGYFVLAISGSRIEEVEIFAKYHQFDDWIGQDYERTADGRKYTGKVFKTYKDKHVILKNFIKKHDLTIQDSVAVGDTGSDISMLEMVENPIAFNPNHILLEQARDKGWKIVVERKSIAYELEPRDGHFVLA